MRKLPQFGCSGKYDGFKIGLQDKAGYPHRPQAAPADRGKEAGARSETRIKNLRRYVPRRFFLLKQFRVTP